MLLNVLKIFMIMKKSIIFLLFFIFSCNSIKLSNNKSFNNLNKAQIIYLYNLNIIYDFVFYDTWKDAENRSLEPAVSFLENITKIKSNYRKNMSEMYWPTVANYNEWKNWFIKNKEKIFWDEKERKVKLTSL